MTFTAIGNLSQTCLVNVISSPTPLILRWLFFLLLTCHVHTNLRRECLPVRLRWTSAHTRFQVHCISLPIEIFVPLLLIPEPMAVYHSDTTYSGSA
jgi:hypothetical protein